MRAAPVTGPSRRSSLTDRLGASIAHSRLGRRVADVSAELHARTAPTHWTDVFGAVSMACLVVLFGSGIFLMVFYTPSNELVRYDGSYPPLHGAEMSRALASTLHVSLDVPGGLLMRQMHHWAALLLPATVILQLVSAYFRGAFRRPRRASWVLLFLVFVLALASGWSGYALPDDMLSSTGLRIVEGIVLGIPFIGTDVSWLLFGGEFPGSVLANLYPIHLVAPVLLLALVVGRGLLAYRHGPMRSRGWDDAGDATVGVPVLPNAAVRSAGTVGIAAAVIALISSTVTIGPIWLYGPAAPGSASAGSQPDWYTGFLDGALRLVPPGWEVVWLDRTWTLAVLVPLAVVTLALALVPAYPFIEGWIAGDDRDHHVLDRPRDTPTRTGIGVAGLIFFGVLWLAGSADLAAVAFSLSIEGAVAALQVALLLGPAIGFELTRRVCLGLQRKDAELVLHGFETGRIVRLPGGEYVEVHQPISDWERRRLTEVVDRQPLTMLPDERGRITPARRIRVALSRFFFEVRMPRPAARQSESPAMEERRAA